MLQRLLLRNYRCLDGLDLKFGRRTVLLGANGSGKSSVFDALRAIQDLVVWNREVGEAFPADTVRTDGELQAFVVTTDTVEWVMKIRRVPGGGAVIALEELRIGSRKLYWAEGGEVRYELLDGTTQFIKVSATRSLLGTIEPGAATPELDAFLRFVRGWQILRPNPALMRSTGPTDDPELDLDGRNFPAWCRHLLARDPAVVAAAVAALGPVVPGLTGLRTVSAGRQRVLVADFGGPEGRDFDLLSDGQKMLVLLYVLLAAIPGRATIVCLDEPDNWVALREIQPFLLELLDRTEEAEVQTLIASHSGEVIDWLGPEDAWILGRDARGATTARRAVADPDLALSEVLARGWDALG